MEKIFEQVAKELGLSPAQITNTMQLLDEGATIPFIARYRKEVTNNLDEIEIGKILETVTYQRSLEKRKEEVIRLIEEQGKLTDEIVKSVALATKLQEVEDIYFPYRKKRKTKADTAKERGLEPLANYMLEALSNEDVIEKAREFITEEVPSVEEAVEGAMLILAQNISETPTYREQIREIMLTKGIIATKESKKARELDIKKVYSDYYQYNEPISKMPSHRILAVNRGESEEVLTVSIEFEDEIRIRVERVILKDFKNKNLQDTYQKIVVDALDRLILPSIEREVRNILTDKAEEEAIKVFKENLKNLLMQAPLKEKSILALDPGYRTGCKVAIIDKNGFYIGNDVFFLVADMHTPKQLETAEKKIVDYVKKYNIDIIVIGNGTASRESEAFIAKLIQEHHLNVEFAIISEAGASVYSASQIAKEEFPDYHVEERSAVSIARRLQDPLAELVKIEPKAISVGQYQHDIPEKDLEEQLDFVVEKTVNNVGVDINTASKSLLKYVAGLNAGVAQQIVLYRNEHGKFHNRNEIKNVKKLGAKTYTQAIGFLRILDGDHPLDATAIHPENYQQALDLLNLCQLSLADLGTVELKDKLLKINKKEVIETLKIDQYTLDDIIDCLIKPNRSIRDQYQTPLLKKDILHIEDLKPGMVLEGTVRNVVDFGAFVDIGLKNDGLVHISKMSKQRIKHPLDVLSIGDIVEVNVIDVDLNKKRVSLSMI